MVDEREGKLSLRESVLLDAGLNPDEFVESKIDPAQFALADWPNTFKDLEYPCHPCAMCGHMVRWLVCFRHLPSGELIGVGEDCAEYLDSENVVEKKMKQFKTAQKNKAEKLERDRIFAERRTEMEAEAQDVIDFLNRMEDEDKLFILGHFLFDMQHNLNKWGSLTEKQIAAVRKIAKKQAEFDAAKEADKPESPLPAGKVKLELAGEVIKTDWKDGYYPGQMVKKMLVKLVDGNKVWGTVPKAIHDADKGDKVSFIATLTRSKDDEHFGFYSNPSKAVIEKRAVTT